MMDQPMLVLKSEETTKKVVPHLLPCRIRHDGPLDPIQSFWTPDTNSENPTKTAYFRGRKLQATSLNVPEGYRGVVVEAKAPEEPSQGQQRRDGPEMVDVDSDEQEVPLGTLESTAEFDKVLIWGHESLADAASDSYMRGVEEWLQVANQIHECPPAESTGKA